MTTSTVGGDSDFDLLEVLAKTATPTGSSGKLTNSGSGSQPTILLTPTETRHTRQNKSVEAYPSDRSELSHLHKTASASQISGRATFSRASAKRAPARPWDKTLLNKQLAPLVTNRLDNVLTWLISEASPKFCHAIWEYFWDYDTVKIVCSSNPLPKRASETSPNCFIFEGNIYGFKESLPRWIELEEYFGSAIIDKIRDHIKTNYIGQAPLYTSFILQTGHPIIKYLVYTASYITKKTELLSSYYATWSALVAMQTFNRANQNVIQQFVSRGFQILDSGDEESARQMWLAYYNFMYPPAVPTPDYMAILEDVLNTTSNIFAEERKAFFLEKLIAGEIEKRGFIDEASYEYCVILLTNLNSLWETDLHNYYDPSDKKTKKKIRDASGKVVVKFTWPNEYIPGAADKYLDGKMLRRLLKLVEKDRVCPFVSIEKDEVKTGPIVAEGASGKVFKAEYKGMEVAVKTFNELSLSYNETEIKREIGILSFLKHPNLVTFYGACVKPGDWMIVEELIPGGSLYDRLHDKKNPVTPALQYKWALELAKGMEYLHSKNVIHRDLKTLNVLVDGNNGIKIIDFGCSRAVDRDTRLLTQGLGTVTYMAPEIFSNRDYSEKVDVYSYGIVLWEIYTKQTPFGDISSTAIPLTVTNGKRPEIPRDMKKDLKKLIRLCWDKDPPNRPHFTKIVDALKALK